MSSILLSWNPQKPTHTSKLLLSILSTIFVVSGAFADPDIAPSASTADCKYTPLETYTGTSNLQADWSANTIDLHWYNDDTELTVPSASQSCVYDGTLTPPATIPTKTGYTFKGWRVRIDPTCGVTSLNYTENTTSTGYIDITGNTTSNADVYGLTSAGTWAMEFTYGIIYGESKCTSSRNNPSVNTSGYYCWCKVTGYKAPGRDLCNVTDSSVGWYFFRNMDEDTQYCRGSCAGYCALYVKDSWRMRKAMYGQ